VRYGLLDTLLDLEYSSFAIETVPDDVIGEDELVELLL